MQYLINIKYNGKPNPRNSSSLEFPHKETSFFIIGFKQQVQYTFFVCNIFISSTRPGLTAFA
jgi:hypothetical protein